MPEAQAKGLSLRVVSCDAVVRGDPSLVERLVGNLVSNAVRYTEEGEAVIECSRRDGNLRIEVRDTGVGMAEDQQQIIFDDFYQVGNVARDRSKGMGLGLSIAAGLAQLLETRIELESTPGKGSVFALELPVASEPAAIEPAAQGTDVPPITGETVLVVDDDEQVRLATRFLLESWGYRVRVAATAEEAVDVARGPGNRPSVVVSDYRLPGASNGVETLKSIGEALDAAVSGIIRDGRHLGGDTRRY